LQFDRAAFYFKALPFTIPYPVPFRYLGDETKGAPMNMGCGHWWCFATLALAKGLLKPC